MRITSLKNTHRMLALLALVLSLSVAGWNAPTLLAYSNQMVKTARAKFEAPAKAETKAVPAAVAAMQQLTKEQKHARMKELQNQIAASKGQAGQQAALDAALVELKQISDSMGGDLPANEGSSTPGQTGGAPPNIGVIPPAGQGCVLTTAVTTNSTPVAIPTGPAVVTSTVTVAGAGPYIWDVNLRTAITHSFAADLDITIQSPAGTVVTLTTDNGAGNDNTFNGTVWDDDANPAGQVPYTTNNGLVTDHAYVNLTLASPLVPEEAMAAFNGEDPNGTWTITISDDLAGDGGSLDNWDLEISTLPAAPPATTTSATQNTPVAIPTGPAVVTSTVVVAGAGATLSKLTLLTNITHSFAADLDITLQSPAGTVVTLTTDNGAGNDNTYNGTLWDDDANAGGQVPYTTNNGLATDHAYVNLTTATPLVPEEAMGAFIGEDPNGTWTITISDDLAGDGGSLDSWTLNVTTAGSCCTITCPTNQNAFAGANCTAVVNYPAPTTSGNCGSVTCAPASGATFPLGTTTVTCSVANGPSCSFTVSVADNTPPTVACPAPISVVGDVPTVVNYTVPTAADNCGASVACVPNTGSSFPVGTTTVTCTATDGSQNMSSCNFTVTVVPCTITCPTDQVAWTSGTSAPVNYPAPTTTGNCGTITCSPASGSSFNVGTTTVTCSTTAGPSCSFNVTVNQLTLGAALADPIACTGPGNKVNGSFSATNNSGASATVSVSATLSNIAYLPNTATATQSGSIIVLANVISWTGTLGAGQTVTVNWMGQIADLAQPSSQACSVVTATVNSLPVAGQTQACLTVNCPAVGPGGILPATSEASDQKAGSVLIYNVYTSSTDPTKQNTRINITNVHLTRSAFVHLFFVAEGCAIADSYICLTGNQTASFLASDLDPGTTGYLVAVAVDGIRGCPISFNYLIGDEYVKFNSGHAANLGAIAFSQIAGGLPACDGNSVTAQLNFDGTSYNRTPATLALSNVGSRADGNDTLLILNRIGGNLGIGASSLGTLFGILYDDAENALSFNVTGGCQLRSSLSNNFPRTTPRFETFIPAGRTGWLKLFNQTGAIGMTGAAINFNANAASSAGAFNQGHNLHHLTLNSGMSYVIPVFPPSC